MTKPNIDEAFDEFLEKNKIQIYGLFEQWRQKNNRFQTGAKVKNLDDGDVYILASYDACAKYIWINIRTGTTWGNPFFNNIDPLQFLKNMRFEIIYPIAVKGQL